MDRRRPHDIGVLGQPGAPRGRLGNVVATGVPVFGLLLADADQDGDVDIFVAGSPSSALLKNAGGGVFVSDPAFPTFRPAT